MASKALVASNKNSRRISEIVDTAKKIATHKVNKPKKGKSKSGSKENRVVSRDSAVRNYISMVTSPFTSAPIRVGFGTMAPTALGVAYFRAGLPNLTGAQIAIHFNPDAIFSTQTTVVSGGSAFSNSGSAFLSVAQYNVGGSIVAGSVSQNVPSNATGINSAVARTRTLAGALRLIVTTANNTTPPLIIIKRWNGIGIATLDTITAATIVNYADSDISPAGISCTATTNWLPVDASDFIFANNNNNGANSYNMNSIVVSGLSSTMNLYVEAISFQEYVSGAIQDTVEMVERTAQASMSDYFPSVENMWNYTKKTIRAVSQVQEFLYGSSMSGPYLNYRLFGNNNQINVQGPLIEEVNDDVMGFMALGQQQPELKEGKEISDSKSTNPPPPPTPLGRRDSIVSEADQILDDLQNRSDSSELIECRHELEQLLNRIAFIDRKFNPGTQHVPPHVASGKR